MGNTSSAPELLILAGVSQWVAEDGFWTLHSNDGVLILGIGFDWIVKLSACEPLESQAAVMGAHLDPVQTGPAGTAVIREPVSTCRAYRDLTSMSWQ